MTRRGFFADLVAEPGNDDRLAVDGCCFSAVSAEAGWSHERIRMTANTLSSCMVVE